MLGASDLNAVDFALEPTYGSSLKLIKRPILIHFKFSKDLGTLTNTSLLLKLTYKLTKIGVFKFAPRQLDLE